MRDSLWYLDYYDAPSRLKAPPRSVFDLLPNELLAAIAAQVTTNHHLYQLPLVSNRLRDVAQLTLINPVRIPQHVIHKLVRTTVHRLDLAKQIKEVNLGDFNCDKYAARLDECDPKTFEECKTLVTKSAGAEQWSKLILAKGKGQNDPWGTHFSFYLSILSVIAPNLKRISVEPRPLGNLSPAILVDTSTQFLWELQTLSPVFDAPLLQYFENKLEDLTIPAQASCFKGVPMRNISFTGLSKLKRLSVSMQALISRDIDTTNPESVLPPNLECLKLLSCNRFTYKWMSKLVDCLRNDKFTKLRRLDLYFSDCLRSSLVLICYDMGHQVNRLPSLLSEIESKYRCKITTYTRSDPCDKHEVSDLIHELEAYALLTPAESWIAATKGEQFTATVARADSGVPRARTQLERKILLKNTHFPTAFFTSPKFDGAAWEKVVFFKGTVGTKADFDKKQDKNDKEKGDKDKKVPRL